MPSLKPAAYTQETIVPGRYVLVYRNAAVPADADAAVARAGAHIVANLSRFGIATIAADDPTDATVASRLVAQPNVLFVLHDRYVQAHALILPAAQSILAAPHPVLPVSPLPVSTLGGHVAPHIIFQPTPIRLPISETVSSPADAYYSSPQGWAVQQSGGFGDNVPGGAPTGPWNATRGAGVRIAILDSGIDANQPDLAPNLAFNLSEVDQSAATGLPSPCDDGSPQDQQGHGTWTASLAAAAIGAGQVIGVAPQATLLNIKVLERLPRPLPPPQKLLPLSARPDRPADC